MTSLETLRSLFPEVPDPRLEADGFALWLVAASDMPFPAVQTLEDYGGVPGAQQAGQALWFFFSPDVFSAAARLAGWARFNAFPLAIQIFPAHFRVGAGAVKELALEETLWRQAVDVPPAPQIWVHGSLEPLVAALPGMALDNAAPPAGLDPAQGWSQLQVDSRLSHDASLSWYAVLHPVGDPLDKAFQAGWHDFFNHVEQILQRNKFRYAMRDFFLIFSLDSVRKLAAWCREYLQLAERLRTELPGQYWPCVLAVADKKGLVLNDELPARLGLDWNQLTPDVPYMSRRNALLLSREFMMHDVPFMEPSTSPDTWCCVSLRREEGAGPAAMPVLTPQLCAGPAPHCFYCGQRSHETGACPTRQLAERDVHVWRDLSLCSMESLRDASAQADARGREEGGLAALYADPKEPGILVRALFDVNWLCQLRAADFFWRVRDKDMRRAAENLPPPDSSPVWETYRNFSDMGPEEAEKQLAALPPQYARDFRVLSLRGFAALEQGRPDRARQLWKEAETSSTQSLSQAWLLFLQGRALEYEGQYAQAGLLYEQAGRLSQWTMTAYRRLVCQVKSGFSEQALSGFTQLIDREGAYFNRMLLDPELERGSIPILFWLHHLWKEMGERVAAEEANLRRLQGELPQWFADDDPFGAQLRGRSDQLLRLAGVNNYVASQALVAGRGQLEKDLAAHVAEKGAACKEEFKTFVERLQWIHEESAWFPFPRILMDFNKEYNGCVASLNWALKANLRQAETFKTSQALVVRERERVDRLESRMRLMRLVRDATLFGLSAVQTFFWLELLSVVCIFVVLPLILVYGDKVGLDWTATVIAQQRWQVQKVLFFIVTVSAFAIACLRTTLRFERIRAKVLAKARREAEEIRQRRATAKNAAAG